MNTINVKGKLGEYVLNLPTSLEEITPKYLNDVTKHVKVAPNYVLIGMVYADKLSYLVNANKKSQNVNIKCIPLFIKNGECTQDFINSLECGDKIIIAGSDMAMGHHVTSPTNKITVNNVVTLLSQDNEVLKNLWGDDNTYYFVEFKLVPASAIHGAVDNAIQPEGANEFVCKKVKGN